MARFRFTLQAVLDLREMVEQRKQKAVAALEAERLAREAAVREALARVDEEREAGRVFARSGDVVAMRQQSLAEARWRAEAQRATLALTGTLSRLEAARAELLEAAKARKAVELLREMRLEAWRREEAAREQATLDELATMRAARGAEPAGEHAA